MGDSILTQDSKGRDRISPKNEVASEHSQISHRSQRVGQTFSDFHFLGNSFFYACRQANRATVDGISAAGTCSAGWRVYSNRAANRLQMLVVAPHQTEPFRSVLASYSARRSIGL